MRSVQEMNVVAKVSHFFAVRTPLSALLLFVIVFFGLFAFWLTPKQYNPEIVRPAFAISLTYEGATVEQAHARVVHELIEKVRTVPGVDDMYTQVYDGARIHSTVIFEVGYDAQKAKLDLLSQLDQHSYLAEGFVSAPAVLEINPETIPVLQIAFGGEELSVAELREQVVLLSQQLGYVEGVSEMAVYGGYTPSLVIELDTQALAAEGITLTQLADTIAASQVRSVSASVSSDTHQIELLFDGQVETAAAVGALYVTDTVRVQDVARVYEGTVGTRAYTLHQGAERAGETVMLSVAKVEGTSAPVMTEAFLLALDEKLAHPTYGALSYTVVGNDGATAAAEIAGLTKNLLTSIAIVAMVLFLFLSSRAAGVVLIVIPTTLLIVFGLGYLFGETINRITLFALILSLGLLVDSAIVVTENIHAHLQKWRLGGRVERAEVVVARAVHEIGGGLLLSAITSVIVFLPMGFITGMMGPYMGPISFFVPAALIVSLFVAIIIAPFVGTHILQVEGKQSSLSRVFSGVLASITELYVAFLRRVLYSRKKQRRLLRGTFLLFIFSLLLPMFGFVHFQMLPKADRDQFYVYVDLPVDTNVEVTKTFSSKVAELLLEDADVQHVQLHVGTAPIVDFNGMFKGAQYRQASYQGTLRVNLTSTNDRSRSSTEVVTDVRAHMQYTLPDAYTYVRFMEEPPGPPVRATFVAKLSGVDNHAQQTAAGVFEEFLKEIDGVVDVHTSVDEPVAQVRYRFDHEVAASLGVSVEMVEQAFMLLGEPVTITEFVKADNPERVPVVLTTAYVERDTPADIQDMMVQTSTGERISLGSIVSIEHVPRAAAMSFDGARGVSYVTAEVEERSIVYVMIDVITALVRGGLSMYEVTSWGLFGVELAHGESGAGLSITWGGEWEMTLENFRDLGIAMGVALLLVYGILVAQYNRFATPAYILVTVPLGLVGILWGFLILDQGFGVYLTATALIGFIALIGIVVNNAIIYLEYVAQQEAAGVTFREALLAAGEVRIRPILLTSLTTVLGSLTIAGDPVWSGLAWAIVFGLSLSTVLTLLVYPTLLVYFTDKHELS